jgi:hypothetical protein
MAAAEQRLQRLRCTALQRGMLRAMSKHGGDLPSWGSVRRVARRLGSLATVPAWLSIGGWLLHFLDMAHRVVFLEEIRRGARVDPVAFLQQWGWLVGIAWLVVVVVWAAKRPDAGARVQEMSWLKDSAVLFLRRFEELSLAYEKILPAGADLRAAEEARRAYLVALRNVMRQALATTPRESVEEYRNVLGGILVDYYSDRKTFPASRLAREESLRFEWCLRSLAQELLSPAPADPPPPAPPSP